MKLFRATFVATDGQRKERTLSLAAENRLLAEATLRKWEASIYRREGYTLYSVNEFPPRERRQLRLLLITP